MKLSFSLPSKSSSSSKPNLIKPSKEFNDKTLDHGGLEDSKEYVNEFDASKPLSQTRGKSKTVVIPALENQWRPLKKMKNLELPLGQSDESDLKFETASGLDPLDDSKMSYGLNVRQSVGGVKTADVSKSGEALPRPAPLEAVMLEKLKADLEKLPDSGGFADFEDVPVESFAAALMEGYGWCKGQGIGRNAREDVEVKEYTRRTDMQGLGFVSDVPAGLPKKQEQKDKGRERERNRDEGRERERNRDEGRERERNRDEGRERERNRDEGRERERNRDEGRERERNRDEGRECERNGDEGRARERNGDEGRPRERNGDEGRARQRNRDAGREHERNEDEGRERERNRGEATRVKENRNGGRVKENRDQESDGLAIGKHVRIVGGRDAGLKGTIVEKLDMGWLILKLSKRDELKVRVTDVAELGSKEEERFLKKLEAPKIQNENKGQKRRNEVESVVEKGENGKRDVEKRNSRLSWLTSHIRVRFISKDFKGGKFYLKKGKVVDVIGPSICDVSIDESGELVQGVSEDLLETALPRRGGPVLVLYGKHKGVYGSLVERDLDKETGIVRDADSHELLNVHLEQIAEYIGDPSYLGY